ncbi:hypothetical protein PK35_08980 [Tamlana nanhaiensis]|uniref:Outer membrane protein beta-barrel domain-containing protein n=1 Tax=Neotamlana nanhaiensis TaxID=1382798 RepID=A0A0D7W1X0_9FLAO|nr:hypothetical protein [Tamlana nanhaiensis]KJD33086.1 hypothetical protein PK35_08980 [Tamlana nanhaiensis]
MKKSITLFFLLICVNLIIGQNKSKNEEGNTQKQTDLTKQNVIDTTKVGGVIKGDQKISFIAGIGGSYILKDLYQNPVVDLATKNVLIEKAQNFKSNFSLGIAYTGKTLKINDSIRVPYGLTFITFVNPISINQSSDNQDFFNMLDFGFGIGHKFAGSMMIVATIEFFNVRQPRDWFVQEYGSNNKQFLVDESPQVAFDVSDNNIFKNKMATTFGIKACYTFDIIKSYKDKTTKE